MLLERVGEKEGPLAEADGARVGDALDDEVCPFGSCARRDAEPVNTGGEVTPRT
jgi:hypothetical protein